MFLRDVLKRWNERPVDTANGSGVAGTCRPVPSLLEELATDPEDFAELASVLKLDMQSVVATLVRERLQTPAELVEHLVAHAAATRATATATQAVLAALPTPLVSSAASEAPATSPTKSCSNRSSEVGWGRWSARAGHSPTMVPS